MRRAIDCFTAEHVSIEDDPTASESSSDPRACTIVSADLFHNLELLLKVYDPRRDAQRLHGLVLCILESVSSLPPLRSYTGLVLHKSESKIVSQKW